MFRAAKIYRRRSPSRVTGRWRGRNRKRDRKRDRQREPEARTGARGPQQCAERAAAVAGSRRQSGREHTHSLSGQDSCEKVGAARGGALRIQRCVWCCWSRWRACGHGGGGMTASVERDAGETQATRKARREHADHTPPVLPARQSRRGQDLAARPRRRAHRLDRAERARPLGGAVAVMQSVDPGKVWLRGGRATVRAARGRSMRAHLPGSVRLTLGCDFEARLARASQSRFSLRAPKRHTRMPNVGGGFPGVAFALLYFELFIERAGEVEWMRTPAIKSLGTLTLEEALVYLDAAEGDELRSGLRSGDAPE